MDIHKPKPVHNWRDFLKEVGIIVLGVSIALAGEQMVEKWREHRQYVEARQAMRDELDYNVSNIGRRREFQPCVNRRLQEIGAVLNRAESHQPFITPHWIGQSARLRIRFTAEPEASRSNLFTTAEQSVFGRLYGYLHSIDVEQDRERLAWGRLQMLEGRESLSPEMIYGLRAALADAGYENFQIEQMRVFLGALARQAGIRGDIDIFKAAGLRLKPDVWPHCLPMDTPKEEGERRSRIIPRAT